MSELSKEAVLPSIDTVAAEVAVEILRHHIGNSPMLDRRHHIGTAITGGARLLVPSGQSIINGATTDFVKETPEQILDLSAKTPHLSDDFAGLEEDVHGDDFHAFDKIDEELGIIKGLVVGGRVQRPDTVAVAAGLVAITVYGTPEELEHVHAGDFVDIMKSKDVEPKPAPLKTFFVNEGKYADLETAEIFWTPKWYGSDPSMGSNVFVHNGGFALGDLVANLGTDHHEEVRKLVSAHNHNRLQPDASPAHRREYAGRCHHTGCRNAAARGSRYGRPPSSCRGGVMVKPVFLRVDIETIPSQDTAVRFEFHEKHVGAVATPPDLDAIVADSRLTNPAKIEADIAKKRQKAASDHMAALEKADAAAEVEWRKTSLDAASGHVACVSWASDEEAVDNLHNDALKPFLQDDRHLSPSVTIHGRPGTSCACMYVLLIRHELKIDLAAQAFARVFPLYTCKQFGFEVPTDVGDVPALSPTYATVNDGAWAKLKEKAQFKVETPNLAEVIATIRDQIQPILDTVHTPRLGAAA